MLRGRLVSTTYEYDDQDRVASTIASPAWTEDDRALMLGLQMYEDHLCLCGHPRERAWNPDLSGWVEHTEYECAYCSEAKGEQVKYRVPIDTFPEDQQLRPMTF